MRASEGWLAAAAVPLLCLLPVLWYVVRGEPRTRLVAQNLSQLLAAYVLLLAAQGYSRPAYLDVALVLAVLAPAGTLVYARFLGELPPAPVVRWTALAGVPLTVLPLCVAAGPGRQAVKLLVIGALLLAGALVTSAGSQPGSEPESTGPGGPAGAHGTPGGGTAPDGKNPGDGSAKSGTPETPGAPGPGSPESRGTPGTRRRGGDLP